MESVPKRMPTSETSCWYDEEILINRSAHFWNTHRKGFSFVVGNYNQPNSVIFLALSYFSRT